MTTVTRLFPPGGISYLHCFRRHSGHLCPNSPVLAPQCNLSNSAITVALWLHKTNKAHVRVNFFHGVNSFTLSYLSSWGPLLHRLRLSSLTRSRRFSASFVDKLSPGAVEAGKHVDLQSGGLIELLPSGMVTIMAS